MSRFKNACFTAWTNFFEQNSQILPALSNNFSGGAFPRVFFAVSSPLIPVTLSFSSAIGYTPEAFSQSSPAPLIAATPSYFGSNQGKAEIAAKPPYKSEDPVSEINFCQLVSQPQTKATPLPPESQRYLVSASNVTENKPPQLNFSQKVIKAIRNLFPWSKKSPLQETPSTIVEVKRVKLSAKAKKRRISASKQDAVNQLKSQVKERWEVWVKEKLVAEFSDKLQADMFANSLADFLAEKNLVGEEIQPAIAEGEPAAKVGGELLFVVDEFVSPEPRYQRELIAIKWMNRLRVALESEPLKLAEAQRLMYGLVETADKLEGFASWYGPQFHGRLTANGETFDQNALTAAHRSLPFNTYIKVTNLNNQESAIVRINDRGPYIPPRSLDVSWGVARCLNSEADGVVPYRAVIMQPRGGSI
ncbi:MAG: septal ring lytic transglycosylase RlpA family protein [Oscillatoria sp. PMC 1068.18]|nr:septal ring lytic transglycosylase RlpA family protein [Oscillatoria sp. PMC 1076.18]MEC4991506.1 septal ring lytic transglycosylase RlpA family protein [Oscillatoria sp. PMC 1068.18]